MTNNVVIVENEVPVSDYLRALLKAHFPKYTVIGIARTIESAVELINQKKPVLIFMDVMLEPGTGLEVLEKIEDKGQKSLCVHVTENFRKKL